MFLVMRTAEPKWNHSKLYGFFAALWFFLMEKDDNENDTSASLPEWPNLRYDYRQMYGFNSGMLEPGQSTDLQAPGSSGEWT